MLASLLSALALGEAKHRAEIAIRNAALAAAAGVLVLVAVGFLTAAAGVAIARATGPVSALVILAAFFLLGAIVVYVLRRRPPPPRRLTGGAGAAMLGALGATAASGGDRPARRGPSLLSRLTSSRIAVGATAVAFAAAVLAGRRARRPRADDDEEA